MKKNSFKSDMLLVSILIAMAAIFGSCNKENEEIVIPKTVEEYKNNLQSLVTSEKALLDTCVIGYNKYNFKVSGTANFVPYKTAYLLVLDTAKARLLRLNLSIAEIIALDKTLSIPGKAFWGSLFLSDRRALNDTIVKAEALSAAIIVGTGAGQILQDPKTVFTAAIAKAKTTRDATVTIDRQVKDAITVLKAAEKIFTTSIIPSTIEEYQSRSLLFVNTEKTFVENCAVGYNKDDYNITAKTAYLNALTAALPIVSNTSATYVEISGAMTTLVTPGKTFYTSRFVSDRRTLNDSIIVAQNLNTATLVGTASGQVPAAAKTTFTTAINTAVTSRETAATTEGQVKAAVYKLGEAKKVFLAAIIK
jgi:hypothetical protein